MTRMGERDIREAQQALAPWLAHNPTQVPPLRLTAWQLTRVDLGVLFPGRGIAGMGWRLAVVPQWAPQGADLSVVVALAQLPPDMTAREVAALMWGTLQVQLHRAFDRQELLGRMIAAALAPTGKGAPPPEGPAGAPSSEPGAG